NAPAISSDDINDSAALPPDGATEVGDAAGMSHPASSPGGSYLPSSSEKSVPNANASLGAGYDLPVLAGGGAHASKHRGLQADSDDMEDSAALSWEGATEASDSPRTSHPASSSGGSYLQSSSDESVPNANDVLGTGSGLPVMAGGGAHASKLPAVSDDVYHSGALSWDAATEAGDSVGTSPPASSPGESFLLGSPGGWSESEHSIGSPDRALSSPSRKYHRSGTPSDSSKVSWSGPRSQPPFWAYFEPVP
ncbi:unnamed protein product, partial [Laminaria digitata]